MPTRVLVSVIYHPEYPDRLERQYPDHLTKPGVAKLVSASQATYVGAVSCDVAGKRATRTAVFVFPNQRVWEEIAKDPDVQAVVTDAQKIAGPNGVSIIPAVVEAIKEPVLDPRRPGSQNEK